MTQHTRFAGQWSDFLVYVLLPCLSILVPASFSRSILRRISGWEGLLAADAELAFSCADKYLDLEDEAAWKRRWKQVELLDVRDLFMLLSGRSKSVLAEIEMPRNLAIVRNRVMVGMHWGPAISILKLLANEGMEPTFPYRPPDSGLLRRRPFYYLFSRLAAAYLSKTLGDRAVETGGAGRVLQQLLSVPGSICVLMDAPAQKGRQAMVHELLGTPAMFNVGFPAMFIEQGKEYVLYAMNMADDGTVKKKLEIQGPFNATEITDYLGNYARFLEKHLSMDSAQWRIWRAEHQVWTESSQAGGYQ